MWLELMEEKGEAAQASAWLFAGYYPSPVGAEGNGAARKIDRDETEQIYLVWGAINERGWGIGFQDYPDFVICPGGTTESSPALQCRDFVSIAARPGGTLELAPKIDSPSPRASSVPPGREAYPFHTRH